MKKPMTDKPTGECPNCKIGLEWERHNYLGIAVCNKCGYEPTINKKQSCPAVGEAKLGKEKYIPCDCPKGGIDGNGVVCQKCGGNQWIKNPNLGKRKLTEEESIILDCWYQFSYKTKRGRYAGGRSTLEICEGFLQEHKIINSLGNKRPEIKW